MTLTPGTRATLTGMGGGPCEVVRVNVDMYGITSSVRIRMLDTGKGRTVDASRLRTTPEPTALGGDYVPDPIADAWKGVAADYAARNKPGARPVRQREPRLVSERYLAYVRRHSCCHCGASGPSEAHHWSHHGGVMGAKVDDYRTVPLCSTCHRHWHDHGMLPGSDRVASEALFVRSQADIVWTWFDSQFVHVRYSKPDVAVDALVEAMRKMEDR